MVVLYVIRYSSEEFEKRIKECYQYIQENNYSMNVSFFYDVLEMEEDYEEDEDIFIDEDYSTHIQLDESQIELEISLVEFIDIIEETQNAKIVENVKFVSDKRSIYRVTTINEYSKLILEELLYENAKCFTKHDVIDNIGFTCMVKNGVTLFGVMTNMQGDYEDFFPSVLEDDLFIEIIYDDTKLLDEKVNKIINAYIFELNASYKIKLRLEPRSEINYDEELENQELGFTQSTLLRPLMFGKGIEEVIKLFNDAEAYYDNYDFAIIQYTKVIEYVSQTVIRQEIIEEAYKKLISPNALRPDANYIKELESMFVGFKTKYDTDRNSIKATIRKCCNLDELINSLPNFLSNITKYLNEAEKNKQKKHEFINSAFDLLCDGISDTRNSLTHAKANYTINGHECPEEEKAQYFEVIRIISIQVIRWYSMVNEASRIV